MCRCVGLLWLAVVAVAAAAAAALTAFGPAERVGVLDTCFLARTGIVAPDFLRSALPADLFALSGASGERLLPRALLNDIGVRPFSELRAIADIIFGRRRAFQWSRFLRQETEITNRRKERKRTKIKAIQEISTAHC